MAALQFFLYITKTQSLLKLISIESVMRSNCLILCRPLFLHLLSFPASGCFLINQFFTSGSQSVGVSASTSVLPMNIQDSFPLGWTGWISLQSKGLSRAKWRIARSLAQRERLGPSVSRKLLAGPPSTRALVFSLRLLIKKTRLLPPVRKRGHPEKDLPGSGLSRQRKGAEPGPAAGGDVRAPGRLLAQFHLLGGPCRPQV